MSSSTIRVLGGAPLVKALEACATALIVIDFQMEYFAGGRLFIPDGSRAMQNAKRLITLADAHGMPVLHVRHMGPAGGPLFARDRQCAAFHAEISPGAQHGVVQKTSASSFVGTDLHRQLQSKGIKTLIVCGLMTHNCVSSTVRDARPLGYQVLVAGDACATRDIEAWDGGVLSHSDLQRAALTALSDTFAEVLTTEQIATLAIH